MDILSKEQTKQNSIDIEREVSGLPQTQSAMMASYEKTEILTRPPNVYRQTLNVDNMIKVCTKKLQEDPYHKKALFIRASSHLKKGNYQASIDDCNNLMKLDSNNAGAFYVRGCAFEKLDMTDESINDFTSVLEIDPYHINAAYARGACENKRGNFAKAIEDYNMALAIDQERPISPNLNRR
jgi:tetratricopeptide (TPR) repeat protein